jgi:hypothetical protein
MIKLWTTSSDIQVGYFIHGEDQMGMEPEPWHNLKATHPKFSSSSLLSPVQIYERPL